MAIGAIEGLGSFIWAGLTGAIPPTILGSITADALITGEHVTDYEFHIGRESNIGLKVKRSSGYELHIERDIDLAIDI